MPEWQIYSIQVTRLIAPPKTAGRRNPPSGFTAGSMLAMPFAMVAPAMIVVSVMSVMMVMAVIIMGVAMPLAITRRIFVSVPVVPHKIHGPSACLVLIAVFGPVFFMTRRHAKVNGLRIHVMHLSLNDDRLRVNYLRSREIPDIDLTVKAWLADVDRYSHIGCHGGGTQSQQARCNNENFHDITLSFNE